MSDKYIIKNCPAILRMTKICDAYETTRDLPVLCQDCTDCVMKQIVEYCKTTRDVYCYGQKHNIRWIDANNILKKLDIQEVE